MNILLVGGKSHFLQLLIEKLNKEGHRIFILTNRKVVVLPAKFLKPIISRMRSLVSGKS